ncbi:hypothetical protein BASA81_007924 [Batrachochytrium salamandrivorans]|nr:hypothetical protein BASA81_007924 [Batrachochytrium salamandrivorans]
MSAHAHKMIWRLLLVVCWVALLVSGRKSAKEWAAYKQVVEEEDEEKSMEKYGLIRVSFGAEYTPHERNLAAKTWHEQLLGSGVEAKVFGDSMGDRVVASRQYLEVWEYFLHHIAAMPEVMKATLEGDGKRDEVLWNLPKYRNEYDLDDVRLAEERARHQPQEEPKFNDQL